jgi:3-oxoacyl-[acyl-carrier-protein] synthase-3
MSGIRERRFWPPGTRPSDAAARAGELALARGLSGHGIERSSVGCLIHGAVSRDFLEPATASVVHARLGLDPRCHVFDLSNACLGVLNGMVVIAEMIERGALEAGLVVSGEDGRGLVEETLATLLASRADDRELRAELKLAFASLTIGSGACAVLLARAEPGREIPRLLSATAEADTRHVELCQGDRDLQGSGPTMSTDSEALLQAGVALAQRTFTRVRDERGWTRADVERVGTHPVGGAPPRRRHERRELDPARGIPTVETRGNTGSAALPTALSLALAAGHVRRGERAALLGIGSGLHCLMLGTRW